MRRFKLLRNPGPEELGDHAEAFLERLAGPACLLIEGEDTGRTRALVTLLHGNEPSGVYALHRWLRSAERPAVNMLCIVASVEAALTAPRFSHRFVPGGRDLNRCFRAPFEGEEGALAQEILALLQLHRPEAVIDMHNTSGSGPAFGVCTFMDRQHDALVSLFTQRLIISNLGLGALMDISEHSFPTVTVEVGGREDEHAHALAYEGLVRYSSAAQVLCPGDTDWGLELLHDPIRLELQPDVTLTYAEHRCPTHQLTLRPDIEHLNFGAVSPDTPLGWLRSDPQTVFVARDASGRCAVDKLVRIEGGGLYPAQPLKLFMITGNAGIARSDCLFYAVADDGSAICA